MLSSQKVNQQTTDTLVQLNYFKQQCRDYHDLLTNPTMDGEQIKAFYALKVGLRQLRKKDESLTRPDGMTLTRLNYLVTIAGTFTNDTLGKRLRELAEFGNGFVQRHLVPVPGRKNGDLYFDIDERMHPAQFVYSPEKEDGRDYQQRKPKKYEHCSTPGCPCSAVEETKSRTLVCVDCSVEIKRKVKKTIIRNPIPYPDEIDDQEPAIEDQVTEPLPVVTLPIRVIPIACRVQFMHREQWVQTLSGVHCPTCEPAFAI